MCAKAIEMNSNPKKRGSICGMSTVKSIGTGHWSVLWLFYNGPVRFRLACAKGSPSVQGDGVHSKPNAKTQFGLVSAEASKI